MKSIYFVRFHIRCVLHVHMYLSTAGNKTMNYERGIKGDVQLCSCQTSSNVLVYPRRTDVLRTLENAKLDCKPCTCRWICWQHFNQHFLLTTYQIVRY
jgi:hypothetical protein